MHNKSIIESISTLSNHGKDASPNFMHNNSLIIYIHVNGLIKC